MTPAAQPRPQAIAAAPALALLLPALVVVPLALLGPALIHGGGWPLMGQFVLAAVHPSLEPAVLRSLLNGLGTTVAMALLGWAASLMLGVTLGVACSRTVARTLLGTSLPAELLHKLLALPRAVHELLWGLLLLQLIGLEPAVAVVAIAIPFGALVARVVSDLIDALPRRTLQALQSSGAKPGLALLSALAPPLLPQLLSYSGYRLECALRSATLLGVFGLGGLGTDLRLTLQSLNFRELWSGLWLLLAVMVALESLLGWLRRRWAMPHRFGLRGSSSGRPGRELLAVLATLAPLLVVLAWQQQVDPTVLLHWQSLPALGVPQWNSLASLNWPLMIANTLLLSLSAAALAVGGAPLLLLLVKPWPWAELGLRALWLVGRLWPPPLTGLLLLFLLKPGVITAALALGFHNLGILGRLLLECAEGTPEDTDQALQCAGAGPRLALLYGRFNGLAQPYLAYGAYRADVILRESVVVGLVGATGLGSQLLEALSSMAWEQVIVLVAVYAALTLLGEDLSDRARRHLLESTHGDCHTQEVGGAWR